jgi:CubicO group peptidase (beta-lactamase class C family)
MTEADEMKDHPLEGKATGTLTLANWQQNRAYGLRNFERVVPDLLAVNAEQIRPLSVESGYGIDQLPGVKALCAHRAFDGLLVLRGDRIAFETYGNGMTPTRPHSCQSSSKTIMNILAGKAILDGDLDPEARVEDYIPEIGAGFRGRTVDDVLAMNVIHELDEAAAYTEDTPIFEADESTIGFRPSSITPMNRRELIAALKAGNEDGSNENRTGGYFYASINTDTAGWLVERATDIPLQRLVRNVMHAIGGENTVQVVADRTGVPFVGGGFVMTLRDFGRYGMLLGSGGTGVGGELLGGGAEFVKRTLEGEGTAIAISGEVVEGYRYINSAFASSAGFGHAGWGGQWVWADPDSDTVIASFGGMMGLNPAEAGYGALLVGMTQEVVEYARDGGSAG